MEKQITKKYYKAWLVHAFFDAWSTRFFVFAQNRAVSAVVKSRQNRQRQPKIPTVNNCEKQRKHKLQMQKKNCNSIKQQKIQQGVARSRLF
ncbi:MAG: hypothetical protein ACI4QH_00340 [Candidatus Fimimonas sp.]